MTLERGQKCLKNVLTEYMDGPIGSDHKCSLNPEEFSEMVKSIRTIESALGNPRKKFLESEKPCFSKLGKSVVAGQKLEKGTIIALEHLKIKVN